MFARTLRGCVQKVAGSVPAGVGPQHLRRAVPPSSNTHVRNLNVHEYVGMEIFQRYGINVPKGSVVTSSSDVRSAYAQLTTDDNKDVVIKSQILAGGRGLGTFKNGFKGGVHLTTSAEESEDVASKMLNQVLVTKQTGEQGRPVDTLLMVERVFIRRELYLSITLDRATCGPLIVASQAGGTSIEDVAHATPEKIFKVPVNIHTGPTKEQLDKLAADLGFSGDLATQATELVGRLYNMFMELDMTMVEVGFAWPFCCCCAPHFVGAHSCCLCCLVAVLWNCV